jgi:hypothetical protein
MAKRTYNRRGRQTAKTPVTSSKRRPQRIKGAQTARRTGSKDKMTVSGQRNIKGGPRGAQGPANPPVQGPSRRTPTAIGGDTGRRIPKNKYGTAGTPKSGPPMPKTPKTPGKFTPKDAKNLKAAAQMVGLALAGKLAESAGKTGQSRMSRLGVQGPAKPAPARRGMSSMGKDYKTKEKEAGRKAIASNFDQAFAAARRAGKKEFTWRGKRYNTKMK